MFGARDISEKPHIDFDPSLNDLDEVIGSIQAISQRKSAFSDFNNSDDEPLRTPKIEIAPPLEINH